MLLEETLNVKASKEINESIVFIDLRELLNELSDYGIKVIKTNWVNDAMPNIINNGYRKQVLNGFYDIQLTIKPQLDNLVITDYNINIKINNIHEGPLVELFYRELIDDLALIISLFEGYCVNKEKINYANDIILNKVNTNDALNHYLIN